LQTNKLKYVNMADIVPELRKISTGSLLENARGKQDVSAVPASSENYWYVEALFFAYRDFISDPDRMLKDIGFGRAHHRVLHFVHRHPGMRVADLLEILQITKQSLARVLRELIKDGYVMQQPGKTDKRERLLYVTQKGALLAGELAAPQLTRIEEALAAAGKDGHRAVARFLKAMMSTTSRRD
jgi:DNA-binding MarR family transcriptional regulator